MEWKGLATGILAISCFPATASPQGHLMLADHSDAKETSMLLPPRCEMLGKL